MDSGLIFPIIVALWAVYLVPQWIRRRQDLSAARSVDRVSAAMRVLARRDEHAVAEHHPTSGSYVLMPPREDVQDLVVKRARPVDTAPTRELAPSLVDHLPNEGPDGTVRDDLGAGRGAGAPAPADSGAVATSRRSPVPGLLLLTSLAALPVLTLLALLGVVGGAWTLLPVVTGLWAVVVLRRAAVRRSAARRAAARRRAELARPSRRTAVVPADGTGGQIPDFVAAPFEEADVAAEPVDESWTPVPVPPPTYTLKPTAPPRRVVQVEEPAPEPRPVPVPAAVEAPVAAQVDEPVVEQPAPAVVAEVPPDEPVRPVARRAVPDLDLVLERRRASGE